MFSSIRRAENRRLDFCPFRMLVDSTRRKSLIRWQKRAAMWEHGFESRWGHQPFGSDDSGQDSGEGSFPRKLVIGPALADLGSKDQAPHEEPTVDLTSLLRATSE
jgi:hypothetical protein